MKTHHGILLAADIALCLLLLARTPSVLSPLAPVEPVEPAFSTVWGASS